MNGINDITVSNVIYSSICGVVRGVAVQTVLFPIEVVKLRQQCQIDSNKSVHIAREILQKEGFGAFYKGITPQLLKIIPKQAWVWPAMTVLPTLINRFHLGDIPQQTLTGLAIATVNAAITTPLETAKILAATSGKNNFSLANIYKNGWHGFATHWAKSSVNWSTFLVAQRYLRDRCRTQPEDSLSLPQLSIIGAQVAFIVSLVSAPFDVANTLKQTQKKSIKELFSKYTIRKFYCGWPLSVLSLTIHNVASVIVLQLLEERFIDVERKIAREK